MSKDTRIAFTGDMSFSSMFQKAYLDDNLISNDILDYLQDVDGTVINYESPITPLKHTRKLRLAHRTDPEALQFIKKTIPNPILSFANNHMMDFGSVGFLDTIDETSKNNIPYIGAGKSRKDAARYQIIGDEVKVGILAVQYKKLRKLTKDFIGPLHEDMIEDIEASLNELRPQVDWIVLVYHGGDEFLNAPMPYIRKRIQRYLKMDIDVIVAHHPHVIQGYETFNDKMVFYSLGNFIFDSTYQQAQQGTENGILLKLRFNKEKYQFDSMPVFNNRETNKIERGKPSPYFTSINDMNYRHLWTYESTRKPIALANATVLRRKELAEIREDKQILKDEYRFLKDKYSTKNNESEELKTEANSQSSKVRTSKSRGELKRKIKRFFRKVYRSLFTERQKTYRKIILILGRIQYKIFYNGRNPYQEN